MILIEIGNMRLIDETALKVLRDDSVNGVSGMKLSCLAVHLRCTLVTAHATVSRLESAGHLKRIGKRGRQSYQVFP